MKKETFIEAITEIKKNGGTRKTFYIHETWKERCMTIFEYTDGTAEVFENSSPFACFNSVLEALATLSSIQQEYNREVEECKARFTMKPQIKAETIYDYYGVAGRYYGD